MSETSLVDPRGVGLSPRYLGGKGAYSWQGFFSTKFVNNPAKDTMILTMSTPGFDGALPQNPRIIAAANAAVNG